MSRDAKVDAYLAKVKPFALPILQHLRELVHKACPEVEEAIKWSRPFFVYKGAILGNMSAFNEHCSFGFWGEQIGAQLREAGVLGENGMGSLGRITSLKDLPPDKNLLNWMREAAAFIDRGKHASPIAARSKGVKVVKGPLQVPPAFAAALKNNEQAAAQFERFSPSCKREYLQWIVEAKRDETRDKRIATAVEWIAEGKQRNWKYMLI